MGKTRKKRVTANYKDWLCMKMMFSLAGKSFQCKDA